MSMFKGMAGALALATSGMTLLAMAPTAAMAQTDSQKTALASAIQSAASSVSGTDAVATAARAAAVKAAIDTFVANNGIDGSIAPALVSGALALVSPTVAALPGVSSAASSEGQTLQAAASSQSSTGNANAVANVAAITTANAPASGSGSGSGSGGGGGGGGGATPYGVHELRGRWASGFLDAFVGARGGLSL